MPASHLQLTGVHNPSHIDQIQRTMDLHLHKKLCKHMHMCIQSFSRQRLRSIIKYTHKKPEMQRGTNHLLSHPRLHARHL